MRSDNKILKLDALFFAAHPDDAELCSGGTIIKMIRRKYKVGIIDLTKGELGTRGNAETRTKETIKANKILGLKIRENLAISDGNIENNLINRSKVIDVIRKYKPEVIFIPYPDDRHPDHIHASNLIKDAAFYSGLEKIESENGLSEYRPKKNIFYMQTNVFEPSFIVDISDTFEDKMKAIRCYSTQFYNKRNLKGKPTLISDQKYIDFITARARFYGFRIGKEYGEPFYTDGKIELDIDEIVNR